MTATYRLLCDENAEPKVVSILEEDGHDTVYAPEVLGKGASDPEIATHARKNGRVVLTNDKDFLDTNRFSEVKVLYYSYNEASAHEISEAVNEVAEHVPDQSQLPRTVWLEVG